MALACVLKSDEIGKSGLWGRVLAEFTEKNCVADSLANKANFENRCQEQLAKSPKNECDRKLDKMQV